MTGSFTAPEGDYRSAQPAAHATSQVELDRRQYRLQQQIKSVITSLISTVVFVVIIVVGLKLSPGWPRVKETFFSGEYFVQSFPDVLKGLWLNIKVLLVALVGVAILSTLIALVRTSRSPILFPVRILALIYTTVMRGVPIIVVLYLIGFGIPGLGLFGRIDPSILGTIAVIMGYSAYVSEVLRAGFNDVHPSQRASARSLGLTAGQTTRLVVIPQALRKVAPALMNDFISMQKDVGLISVLGAVDAVRAAQIDVASTYNFTPYVVASLLFILLSVPFILLNDWYTARLRKRELSAGTV
ncbi:MULTISPECIES: amino acid ABC transporter permease [Bifidobacterium]|uniref:Amino acid ABC superfamily ATP binding cassette transporter permease protein n=1 Tax=Bifidobacterium reuteri DSM 23975 TaxID=1437610 RepID=A0A087CZ29_9BIFI|nr:MULTISPECIES: amino acid ABC transporter permease [Bifidobacterium]KFI88529.1 amino acid ABC superfamily ATP binding cassette transporter permease protein [Bifidobacterium reuteri DSM 23975]TPF78892.1 ABC transporter permease [Bifidobacterium sp. UTCIF-1]TPF79629.1 ABC transporter permease [Bifidobacterium sp. UTCIF-24]TPF82793.1 ABC transporter permease [Bifidobacterium sp. UTCIF-3]TPF83856.1 ABC transporter permease [Bifidobacterium sp. UTCIF-36]